MSEERSPKRIKPKKPFSNSSTDLSIWQKIFLFGGWGKWKHGEGTESTWELA